MEPDASFEMDVPLCPSFHLSREQLKATDLLNFVQKVFREQPNLPAFKIVPPKDWSPTQRRPNLDELVIQTPIKQLVRKTSGFQPQLCTPHSMHGPQKFADQCTRAGFWKDWDVSVCACRGEGAN
jgi:hypothetical protein